MSRSIDESFARRWSRRALTIPGYVLGFVGVVLLLPALLPLALIIDLTARLPAAGNRAGPGSSSRSREMRRARPSARARCSIRSGSGGLPGVRRWVPELARVPAPMVHEPWRLTPLEQKGAGLAIGRDYPMPVVDHGVARARTLAAYARARGPR